MVGWCVAAEWIKINFGMCPAKLDEWKKFVENNILFKWKDFKYFKLRFPYKILVKGLPP